MIHVGFISALGRLRDLDPAQVSALAESIKEVGLLNPITVYQREIIRSGQPVNGYGLIAGAHRLEACKSLGWQEIPAVVVDLDDEDRIIAECDENLCGTNLGHADRAYLTHQRKIAYERLHPETVHGGDRKSESSRKVCDSENHNDAKRFTADTAEKTGKSERSIQFDAERGEKIVKEALGIVRGTKLDTGEFLDKLKKKPQPKQAEFAKAQIKKSEATKPKKPKAPPKTNVQKAIDAVEKLNEAERHEFDTWYHSRNVIPMKQSGAA